MRRRQGNKQRRKSAVDEVKNLTPNDKKSTARDRLIKHLKLNRKGDKNHRTFFNEPKIDSLYHPFLVMERDDSDGTYFLLCLSDGLIAWSKSEDELEDGDAVRGWLVPPINVYTTFPDFILDAVFSIKD